MKLKFIYILSALLLIGLFALVRWPVGLQIIRHGDSDIYDYQIFPSRKLSPDTHRFFLFKDTTSLTNKFKNFQKAISLNNLLTEKKTLSLIISHGDSIVLERYYNGADSAFYSLYFSMTKSVMSLLIGCAIDDHLIFSEYDTVTKYIPEFKDRGFKNITLLDLLNMQAPLNYTENSNPFGEHARFYYTSQLEQEILKLTANENREKKFVYRSGNYAILGLILKRVLKKETITHYLERKIWKPLKMENIGIFSIDHEGDGIEKVWCCLAGTARDFLRIANLYLHNGKCGSNQIVSESWISKTIRPLYAPNQQMKYSYGWWLFPKTKSFMAIGKDGQFAYINSTKAIIIIRLGDGSGKWSKNKWNNFFSQIVDTM